MAATEGPSGLTACYKACLCFAAVSLIFYSTHILDSIQLASRAEAAALGSSVGSQDPLGFHTNTLHSLYPAEWLPGRAEAAASASKIGSLDECRVYTNPCHSLCPAHGPADCAEAAASASRAGNLDAC